MSPASRYHRSILLIAALIITASVLLSADPDGVYLLGWQLPESCVLKRLTGRECPGCGLTRSFVYMGHLDLAGAFARHWLGPILWSLTAAQLPYRAWRLLAQRGRKGPM